MHKDKVLKLAKGFRGRAKNCVRIARQRVEKAMQYAFRDRRAKKRDMRSLWITRINAGARHYGVRRRPPAARFCLHLTRRPAHSTHTHSPLLLRPPPSLPTRPTLSPRRQVKYSELVSGLQRENVRVNRRMLSELAANEPYSFRALVDQVRFMRGGAAAAGGGGAAQGAAQ
jgi:large subunit ribosomal protein L20